jgi:hypothetical protein
MTAASRMAKAILIGLTALTAASCDDDGVFEASVQNLAGVYRLTGLRTHVHPNTQTFVDIMAATPCFQDNRLQINADGTFRFFDEGLECNPSGDHEGTWSLPSRHIMLVSGTPAPIEIEFDGRTLVQRIYETASGVTTVRTVTMVKQ